MSRSSISRLLKFDSFYTIPLPALRQNTYPAVCILERQSSWHCTNASRLSSFKSRSRWTLQTLQRSLAISEKRTTMSWPSRSVSSSSLEKVLRNQACFSGPKDGQRIHSGSWRYLPPRVMKIAFSSCAPCASERETGVIPTATQVEFSNTVACQTQIKKPYYEPYLKATEPLFIKPRKVFQIAALTLPKSRNLADKCRT